uniref:EGF-like domain-containing protein n=1 Tax=Percolomonas cosmopolitus TaxID=63605 RepID=A0A7S1PGX9_9EUKA
MSSSPFSSLFTASVCILIAFLLSSVVSQEFLNNIIKFGSPEARETYVRLLQRQDPQVQVMRIDKIFTGLITVHSSIGTFDSEKERLNRMFVASPGLAILGFERDQVMSIAQTTESNAPWHLDRIDQRELPLNGLFRYHTPRRRVNVYIVDTGIRTSHSEFGGRARAAYSAVPGQAAGQDCNGHGTHVAGLVGGRTYGANKSANLWDVRVLGCNGQGATSGILRALDWIASNARKPAVINMSLGGGYSSSLNDGVDALARSGILPVVASGNEASDACRKSPSSAAAALTVGASTTSDTRSSFSNYGRCVDVYSPGSNILSAGIRSDRSTARMSGTSMASPITAGVASALLAANPNINAGQLKDLIVRKGTTSVRSTIQPLLYFPLAPQVRQCPTGYTGDNCEVSLCFSVPATDRQNVCSGNGRCISPNRCVCESGFSGPTCANARRPLQPEQPDEPEPEPVQPEPEPEPGQPSVQPGTGKVIALISGAPTRTVRLTADASVTLDASVSHLTQSFQTHICKSTQNASTSSIASTVYSEWIPVVGTLGYEETITEASVERQVRLIRTLWNNTGNEDEQGGGASIEGSTGNDNQGSPMSPRSSGRSRSDAKEGEATAPTTSSPQQPGEGTATTPSPAEDSESMLSFRWLCTSELTNSAQNPFCKDAQFEQTSALTLSSDQLTKMKGLGPVLFTVVVQYENFISEAHVVMEVQA